MHVYVISYRTKCDFFYFSIHHFIIEKSIKLAIAKVSSHGFLHFDSPMTVTTKLLKLGGWFFFWGMNSILGAV